MTDVPAMDAPINLVNEHNCFGCGTLNVHGLQLKLHAKQDGSGIWTTFTPDVRFEGYGGMVHGGIISTVLDEVMAWSLYRIGAWAVTAQMNVRYRQPVRIGEETRATGEVVRQRGRLYEVHGEIRRATDDALVAEATATFMRVPQEQAAAWEERYGTRGEGQ